MAIQLESLEAVLGLNTTRLNAGLARAQASMRNAGRKMQSIGRSMTLGLSLPLAVAGGAAVKMASDFEASMSKIVGLVGIAASEVQGFRGEVLRLAGETGRGPQELGDALFFITSAGLRGAEAMDVLKQSAKAAAAGLGNTATVADVVTSAVNAYGSEVLSATQATDLLTAAVREGKSPPEEIAQSIGQVLPVASELGTTFQEVGAAVAAMSRTGTKAGTAVIQLRQILFSILKPSQQSEQAFKAMGTSGEELRTMLGEQGGLIKLLELLREETKTNSQAFALAFPNVRALAGALDIMGKNAETNKRIFADLTDNVGDTNKAFEAGANTASRKFNQALAELKVTGIELGEILLPFFKDIAVGVRNAARAFQGLSESTKILTLVIFGLGAVVGPVIFLLGKMIALLALIELPILATVAAGVAFGLVIVSIMENWDALTERLSDWSWWKNVVIDMTSFFVLKFMGAIQGFIDVYNAFAVNLGKTPILFNTLDILKGLDEMRGKTEDYEHEFVNLIETIKNGAAQAKAALVGLFPGGGSGLSGEPHVPTGGDALGRQRNFGTGGFDFSNFGIGVAAGMAMVNRALKMVNENVKKTGEDFDFLGAIVGSAFQGMSNVITNALSSTENVFQAFGKFFADFIKGLIIKLIAATVAALALTAVLSVLGIANFGKGLKGASQALSFGKAFKSNLGALQGLASGGSVIQGGAFKLHRDEVVALPAGSAVTPAHMANGGGTLTTRLSLRTLNIELDRERQRMTR